MRRYSAAVIAALLLACTSSRPRGVAVEVPFQLTQDHVYVPVTVGNHAPTWFLLDTGAQITALAQTTADALGLVAHGTGKARGAGARGILVKTPFAEKHRSYDAIAPTIDAPFGVGIGGTTHQRVGRARRFTLAGFTFEAPIVNAAEDRAGATASAEIDGLIGSEM